MNGTGGVQVLGRTLSNGSRLWLRWLRRRLPSLRVTGCFLSVAFASAVIPGIEKWDPANNLLWVANGLLLAYLLVAPRWRWPAYLFAGFLALFIRALIFPAQWNVILLYNLLDLIEIGAAALLLRPRSAELPSFTERSYFIRFLGFGVLLAPALAGAVFATTLQFWKVDAQPHPFLNWIASDSLGIAICTPAFVAVFRARLKRTLRWSPQWYYPALLFAVTVAAFAQNAVPLVYFIYPLLVIVLVRLGLGYASLCTLFVAAIAGWWTIHGRGPFAHLNPMYPSSPALHLQLAIASAVLLIYSVSLVLEHRSAIERRLEKIVSLHALVTENSRDVILLADFHGNRSYISSAGGRFGYTAEEFASHNSIDLIHPDDRPIGQEAVRKLLLGAEGDLIQTRIRNRDGNYVWVESSLRLIRDPKTGAPTGILNMARDISERKETEKKLQDAYKAVEALAATDALTGIANRRRFDQVLSSEWRRSLRTRSPLSLLMIDADLFKSYNDTFGHPRGDSCLKQIAEAAQDVVARPGDLVARFGGEEFAVVLPNTGSDGALLLASEICDSMRGRRLPHPGSAAGVVTVSVGCATLVPSFGQHAVNLIELADNALYRAKHRGRDRAVAAGDCEEQLREPAAERPDHVSIARSA